MDGEMFLSIIGALEELSGAEAFTPEMYSPFNKEKWGSIGELLEIVEAVEFQQMLLILHRERQEETGELCGAVDGYAHAVPILVEQTQASMDRIADYSVNILTRLETILDSFNNLKLRSMANCETPGCVDRDEAREKLGWEKQPLR